MKRTPQRAQCNKDSAATKRRRPEKRLTGLEHGDGPEGDPGLHDLRPPRVLEREPELFEREGRRRRERKSELFFLVFFFSFDLKNPGKKKDAKMSPGTEEK